MITGAFINLAYLILDFIMGIFPASAGLPAEAHSAAVSIGGYLGIFSPIVPIATLLTCVTIVFSVEIGIFGFKTVKWIMGHVPFIGGKG